MSGQNHLIFISYPNGALPYATQAKHVFEGNDYRTWVWEYDRPAIGDRDEILMAAIRDCNHVAFICTPSTPKSEGQIKEGAWAKAYEKVPPILLVFHTDYILEMFSTPKMFNEVTDTTFPSDCQAAIDRHEREQPFNSSPGETDEGNPIQVKSADILEVTLQEESKVVK